MAFTRIRLKNFKCFADSGDIPLAPLTVLFGRNNTGKSSIIQSLLILRQSLDKPGFGPVLNLQGPLYAAGTYGDIVHQHRSKNPITIQFLVERQDRRWFSAGDIKMEFQSDEPNPPRLTHLRVESEDATPVEIRRGKGRGGPYELVLGGKRQNEEAKSGFSTISFPPHIFFPAGRLGARDRSARIRSLAGSILFTLQESLENIRAVGAFRQPPERRYEFKGRQSDVIDLAGINVVNALIDDATRPRRRGELFKSVNDWLKATVHVRLLPLRRISRGGARIFEVRMKDTDSGRWANFADVGFGIGQALPVFVEGVRTPVGGTFIVQEPEIHLHPDAQLAMADFLVALVHQGRRVIVETHSEHLLLRIRHGILRASLNGRKGRGLGADQVSMIYVDKNRDGTSSTHKLEVDDLGQIKNWPKGFMEEATDERLEILDHMSKRTTRAQRA